MADLFFLLIHFYYEADNERFKTSIQKAQKPKNVNFNKKFGRLGKILIFTSITL